MGLIQWGEKKIKKMGFWDIGFLKIYCLVIGLIIGAFFPAFILSNLVVVIVIGALTLLRLLYVMFIKKMPE